MSVAIEIRPAGVADAAAIAAVYAPYVAETIISFEAEPPSGAEMARRIAETTWLYPWLVAEVGERIAGYAYGHAFSGRAAYAWSVETSIYVARDQRGEGIGRALYTRLLDLLRERGFHRVFAGISLPNPASVGLHEAVGFEAVGVYRKVGWKFGCWHDVGWWQLDLRPDGGPPGDLTPGP